MATSRVKYRSLKFLGYRGYRVGTDGSVWTRWCRPRPSKGIFKRYLGPIWKELSIVRQSLRPNSYFVVQLRNSNGKRNWYVHQLVLLAFVGPCPKEMEARHYPDRDKSNNNLDNLSWASRQTNHNDQKEHGTRVRGERHGMSKLNWWRVHKIRRLYQPGSRKYGCYGLSRRFKTSPSNIHRIIKHEIWIE